jgi:predicted nucleotide-binding protein
MLPQPNLPLIERSVDWLLSQLTEGGWEADIREAPMFIARCLDGISHARNLVVSDLRARIDKEITRSNKRLMSFWNEDADLRKGSLKAYTAVCEYLGSMTVPAPAGLVFDVAMTTPLEADHAVETRNPAPGIFVVHGRNLTPVRELQNYIQNVLGLGNPIILRDRKSGGDTVIEKFEREAARVGLVFVLMTPDDVGHLANETAPLHRARQNVIFELGYFIGKLGRSSGRVILLSSGAVELPSDITGVIQIDIRHGIEAAGEKIRKELGAMIDELRAFQGA